MIVLGIDPEDVRQLKEIWRGVVRRCRDPRVQNYARYGGAGVTVCDRWADSLEAFVADMGPRPSPLHSIDRIDNAKGYEPGNCRWATDEEQRRNRSDNRWLTHDGRTMVMKDWSKETGIGVGTLWCRLTVLGWSVARALTEPTWASQHVTLTYQGETLHLGEWGRRTGIHWATIRARLRRGWPVERALSEPVRPLRRST